MPRSLSREGSRRRAAIAALVSIVLAACAQVPVTAPAPASFVDDAPFTIEGRLSARRADDAVTANFSWRHAPPIDEFAVTTPLGQALAEISGDSAAGRYELRSADGRISEAPDWPALTERALGVPLPVAGLAFWIIAAPRPGAAFSVEPDADGRVAVLRQDGWEIVYAYAEAGARLPVRLQLVRHEIELRIVVVERRS